MTALLPADARRYAKVLHDEYRTTILNKLYYGCRLEKFTSLNRYFEIVIAVGATGTGIAGFTIWQTPGGHLLFGLISGASVVLATLKPILNFPKQIERYSKLWGRYSRMVVEYKSLEDDIWSSNQLTSQQVDTFHQLRKRSAELVESDDQEPSRELLVRLQGEVNEQVPAASLWMPSQ